MESEPHATAEEAEARSPSPLGIERPPTPRNEPEVVPRAVEESPKSSRSWYEQAVEERERLREPPKDSSITFSSEEPRESGPKKKRAQGRSNT